MAASTMSTPVNSVSRDNLSVLIRNNVMNDSVDCVSDCDCSMMDTDSPIRKTDLQPISKKLFHSPMGDVSPKDSELKQSRNEKIRQKRKRKQNLIFSSAEKIKKAYIQECEGEGYSPDVHGGIRKKVLISLFHNKEYSMDFS